MTRHDRLIALGLFAVAVIYLWSLPRTLGWADEAYFLYEAKRLREGEVLYRDVFQYVTPLSPYLMAALYWLFGTTITTAHLSVAVVHGVTMVFIYASARALGARASLAAAAAVAFLSVGQPAWPYASWHWFSTNLIALLLLVLIRTPWVARPRTAVIPGLVTGALITCQQHRGSVTTAAVTTLFILDHLIDRRYSHAEPIRQLAARLLCFAAGVVLVVVPVLTTIVVAAGFDPVMEALVRFPLQSYRNSYHTTWGSLGPFGARYAAYTFPVFLRYLSLVLLVPATRIAWKLVARIDREKVRRLTVLVVFGIGSIGSILYYPDFIHIAFITPILLVSMTESIEWLLTASIRSPRAAGAVGWALVLVVVLGLGDHLARTHMRLWTEFPVAYDTPFGRLNFASHWEPVLMDRTRALLDQAPAAEMFCYPNLAAPYLTTGAKNPTPFQHFDVGVFPLRDTDRVVATLRARRVPYVLVGVYYLRANDPLIGFLASEYTPLSIPEVERTGEIPAFVLYARKDLAPSAEAPQLR